MSIKNTLETNEKQKFLANSRYKVKQKGYLKKYIIAKIKKKIPLVDRFYYNMKRMEDKSVN